MKFYLSVLFFILDWEFYNERTYELQRKLNNWDLGRLNEEKVASFRYIKVQ
ncbi:MAG: hypothetical protein ACJAYJ_002932 [Saprospiraceae bacterium]|jgi:hypothetical protein